MRQVTSGQAIKALLARGCSVDRQKGSHVTLIKPGERLIITIVHPSKTLSPGLVRDIERKAGFRF